mmetsp:Transcript_1565/g.2147  ORF Transcript_1565/g.2147 Transcript_1565/m.2147 type:complete len:210 (-) Transcript_1565:212-841(-)|eukprot:CAMPEP_0178917048 /NCGR_PEP_ID=MMETSP0786-20121207/13019_1 /TAXON_ID=186022 /ORGANISM="Thalassionema frauenfeldii, Strain CCMP 1798" /LENGTH=209 /DNA_ID=CAMNT_0020590533 /DNA_START=24 /DNA_END=653 /DNA_ORIENTATION=+
MKLSISILSVLASLAFADPDFVVTVTDGPKECEDSDKVLAGKYLSMHYTGTIDESSATGEKGKKFDSSRDRDQTFDFQIGQGSVIKGWDEGLIGLCKGAKATLVIQPAAGYGDRGAGADIPAGATLNFDVEVVDIGDKAPPGPNFFDLIDTNKDHKISKEEMTEFFAGQGMDTIPDGLWEDEDKDGDGFITWAEFNGPKGEVDPSKDEL